MPAGKRQFGWAHISTSKAAAKIRNCRMCRQTLQSLFLALFSGLGRMDGKFLSILNDPTLSVLQELHDGLWILVGLRKHSSSSLLNNLRACQFTAGFGIVGVLDSTA